jgi:hypothetical protein
MTTITPSTKKYHTVSLETIVDNFIRSTTEVIMEVELYHKIRYIKDLHDKIKRWCKV